MENLVLCKLWRCKVDGTKGGSSWPAFGSIVSLREFNALTCLTHKVHHQHGLIACLTVGSKCMEYMNQWGNFTVQETVKRGICR